MNPYGIFICYRRQEMKLEIRIVQFPSGKFAIQFRKFWLWGWVFYTSYSSLADTELVKTFDSLEEAKRYAKGIRESDGKPRVVEYL
jgi:hypothetical protein